MLETVFFAVVVSLFVYQISFFRKQTKKQVNQIMRTFLTDFEPTSRVEKVVPTPIQPIAIQKSINHIKK
jgi:hypothetical protein